MKATQQWKVEKIPLFFSTWGRKQRKQENFNAFRYIMIRNYYQPRWAAVIPLIPNAFLVHHPNQFRKQVRNCYNFNRRLGKNGGLQKNGTMMNFVQHPLTCLRQEKKKFEIEQGIHSQMECAGSFLYTFISFFTCAYLNVIKFPKSCSQGPFIKGSVQGPL